MKQPLTMMQDAPRDRRGRLHDKELLCKQYPTDPTILKRKVGYLVRPVVNKLVEVMLGDILYAASCCFHGCDRLGNAILLLLAIICCMMQIAFVIESLI